MAKVRPASPHGRPLTELKLTLYPNNQVRISGPLDNPKFCIALLEEALRMIKESSFGDRRDIILPGSPRFKVPPGGVQ